MRRLLAGGGIVIAACVCWLLLSGAASARQAADTITVSAIANGPNITFTVTSSPLLSISFAGGSNWQFTAISSVGGSCSLTPTNGGGFCAFPTAVTSFTVSTTINGPTPTQVFGQEAFNDSHTGTFTALVTQGPTECHCTKLSAELTHINEGAHGSFVVFSLTWKLHCQVGAQGVCEGRIKISHSHLPGGMRLNFAHGDLWSNGRTLTVDCKSSPCKATVEERHRGYSLHAIPAVRADETIKFQLKLQCGSGSNAKDTQEELWLKFDANGNLDRKGSHLGKLS